MNFFRSVLAEDGEGGGGAGEGGVARAAGGGGGGGDALGRWADGMGAAFSKLATEAKAKSKVLLDEYKRDLAEFTGSVGEESRALGSDAVANARKATKDGADLSKRVSTTVLKGTTDFVAQVSAAINMSDDEIRAMKRGASGGGRDSGGASAGAPEPTPFERAVAAMQRDPSTYTDEPSDVGAFVAWKDSFCVEERRADIDTVLAENAFMAELQSRIVPLIVEHELFWERYFFRLHLLKQEMCRADADAEAQALSSAAASAAVAGGVNAATAGAIADGGGDIADQEADGAAEADAEDADSNGSSGQASASAASAYSAKSTDFMMVTSSKSKDKDRSKPTMPPPPPSPTNGGAVDDGADDDWATGDATAANDDDDDIDEDWGED